MQHGKLRATLQKDQSPENLTLEEALELLAAKAAKEQPAKKTTARKAGAKTATAKAKKTTTKTPAAKKTPAAAKRTKKADASDQA